MKEDVAQSAELEALAQPSMFLSRPRCRPGAAATVIIPAYDAALFIVEAVESVLNQSFSDYEVIVVNDGSPDAPELERLLGPYRERIVYLSQPNRGPSAARNRGIHEARGEYLAFLDSDDVWMPDYLAKQIEILASRPALDLVYSNGVVIGDVPYAGRDLMSLAPSSGPVTFERLVSLECTVLTSCVVARRQRVIDAGLFDERFRRSEDFHLWARLAHGGAQIDFHREILMRHRRRKGSLSDDEGAMAEAAIEVLQDLAATLPLTASQRTAVHQHIALCHCALARDRARKSFMNGDYSQAAAALERAREWEPNRSQQARFWLLQVGLWVAPRLMRKTYGLLRRFAELAPARSR